MSTKASRQIRLLYVFRLIDSSLPSASSRLSLLVSTVDMLYHAIKKCIKKYHLYAAESTFWQKKMYRQLFFRSDRRLRNWNLTKEKSHGFPAFGSITRHYALNASLRLCSEIAKLVSCYNQFPVFKKRTIMTNFNFEMRFSHDNIVQLR